MEIKGTVDRSQYKNHLLARETRIAPTAHAACGLEITYGRIPGRRGKFPSHNRRFPDQPELIDCPVCLALLEAARKEAEK